MNPRIDSVGSLVRYQGAHPVARVEGWGLGKFLKKVSRAAKKVMRSKVLRVAATGVAVCFPAATPAVVALETANRVIDAHDSLNRKKKKAAARIIAATYKAAKKGDADAKRALQVFVIAKRAKRMKAALYPQKRAPLVVQALKRKRLKAAGAVDVRGQLVLPDGRILRGMWRKAG